MYTTFLFNKHHQIENNKKLPQHPTSTRMLAKNNKKAAAKTQKKVVKAPKRQLATKKTTKTAKKLVAPVVAQTAQIATTKSAKKPIQLQSGFTADLAKAKTEQLAAPEMATMTSQQREFKIRSFQVAWTKNWLCRRGLFYEDIFEEVPDMRLAINILPADVRKDRVRRLIRSCDLDCKLVWLPESMQDYDPMTSYGLDDAIMRVDLMTHSHDNYV